jgi:hypothetical protein
MQKHNNIIGLVALQILGLVSLLHLSPSFSKLTASACLKYNNFVLQHNILWTKVTPMYSY